MQELTNSHLPLETKSTPDTVIENNRDALNAVLKKHKFSVDDLVSCGIRGMAAKKYVRDSHGDIVEELDDHGVQHKFFHSFLLLMGLIKEGGSTTQVVVISPQEKELLEAYKKRVDV